MAKLLHLITNLTAGGAELHLLELLSGLDRERFRIELAYFQEIPDSPPLRPRFEALGIPVHYLGGRSRFDPGALVRLIRLLRRGRFDLLHTHLFRADLYGAVASLACPRLKLVGSIHNQEDFYRRPVWAALGRLAARRQQKTVAISQAVADYAQEAIGLPERQLTVIHYGLEPKKLKGTDIRAEFGLGAATPLVVAVGRLARQKGHIHLVRAMAQVCRELPEARLLIVGYDHHGLEPELKAEAERLGVAGAITFTGFRDDIPDLMAAANVFCLPSLWEGFGLVLIEAMAVARPIVASRVGPIPEVVADGRTGLLVPPAEPEALGSALLRVLTEPGLADRLGRAGQERQERLFSRRAMVEKTTDLYQSVLGGD